MRNLISLVLGLALLGGTLAAQNTGGDKNKPAPKAGKVKDKSHKGGKTEKSKKGSSSTTPPPK